MDEMGFQDQSEFNMLSLSLPEIKCLNSTHVHLSLKTPRVTGFSDKFAAIWDGGILALSGMLLSLVGLLLLPKSQCACPDQFMR